MRSLLRLETGLLFVRVPIEPRRPDPQYIIQLAMFKLGIGCSSEALCKRRMQSAWKRASTQSAYECTAASQKWAFRAQMIPLTALVRKLSLWVPCRLEGSAIGQYILSY